MIIGGEVPILVLKTSKYIIQIRAECSKIIIIYLISTLIYFIVQIHKDTVNYTYLLNKELVFLILYSFDQAAEDLQYNG